MNIERVQRQLELDEGVEHRIYHDHLGLATFGIGHLVLTSDPEFSLEIGTPVTPERVATAFAEDLAIAENECKVLYYFWEELPEEAQEILVNMMFNLGRPRLSKFKKMNAHIEDENWRCAAVEGRDSRWYRQVGQRAERLMVRMENV